MRVSTGNGKRDTVSQESVEILLGKIITDDETRARFFRAPAETCRSLGLVLTEVEMEALGCVPSHAVRQLAMSLDPRIVRAALGHRESVLARRTGDRLHSLRGSSKPSEDLAGRIVELVPVER
jgi:hypothetical protein